MIYKCNIYGKKNIKIEKIRNESNPEPVPYGFVWVIRPFEPTNEFVLQ